ncbi:MAG TPA: class I SAM-dependent methyltransferase [Streptosporangiaceae bacterium]
MAEGQAAGGGHPLGLTEPITPDDLYRTRPPWDIDRPQPAFQALAEAGALRGRVLDAGCGTGEHALMAAAAGLPATGIDLAATALRTAERKARGRGLAARFIRHDARRLAELQETFDTVLDCGLFHIFKGDDRAAYVAGLRSVLPAGGRYFMLAFSDRQPNQWQRHHVSYGDITAAFAGGWRLDAVEPAAIHTTLGPDGIPAWLATATKA